MSLLTCISLLWSFSLATKPPNFIFLMTDSMDGRNLDPTASQYPLMDMHNLRNLASKGVNLLNTYTNSPQCVPGRTTLISGLRTDQSKTFSNGMGFAMSAKNNSYIDPVCKKVYNHKTCERWSKLQQFNLTIFDALTDIGYNVYLYGKMDTGGNITEQYPNASAAGYHNGPGLPITTRAINIWKVVRKNPVDITEDDHVGSKYQSDLNVAQGCIERLEWLKSKGNAVEPWFLYCSFHTPHPPFDTNKTFLSQVDVNNIALPIWIEKNKMHPYDHYMSLNKNVYGEFNDSDINMVRMTYYAMNTEIDYVIGTVINKSYELGFNTSNTIYSFTSDHGEMNMEHRQIWKNSMYDGSSRIPLFFAGPNIKKSLKIKNITQIIDILPTLIDLGGGEIPTFLPGYSLKPYLFDGVDLERPNWMISQYHSNMGNTASFMLRKDQYKYIQFGHYLNAFHNKTLYRAQLFDLINDPSEVNDLYFDQLDVVNAMEKILSDTVNYEYIDCIAKQNDFQVFEDFFWNVYNQSDLYQQFQDTYHDFNQSDWQLVLNWRQQLLNASSCKP